MNMLKPLMHSLCWTAAMHLEIVLQTQGPFEELTWITVVNKKNENEELLKGVFVRNDHIGYHLAVFGYT